MASEQETKVATTTAWGARSREQSGFARLLVDAWLQLIAKYEKGNIPAELLLAGDRIEVAKQVEKEIQTLFGSFLNILESIPMEERQFRALRRQVLRLGNDAARHVNELLENCHIAQYAEKQVIFRCSVDDQTQDRSADDGR